MHTRPARPGRRAVTGQAARTSSGQAVSGNAGDSDSKDSSHDSPAMPRSPLAQTSILPEEDKDVIAEPAVESKHVEDDVFSSDNKAPEDEHGLGLSTGEQEHAVSSPAPATQPHAGTEIPLEAVENALKDLSRDDLVLALKNAKEQVDILDGRVEALTERNETLESTTAEISAQLSAMEGDRSALEFALAHREERIDELMREQDRLEEDVYLRTEVNERLRKQLTDSERARTDAERRYTEQTASVDRERQFYLDQEKLLQTQKSKAAAAYDRVNASQQELARENERLQAQLIELRAGSPVRAKVASPSSQSPLAAAGADGAHADGANGNDAEVAEGEGEDSSAGATQTTARTLHAETETSNELDSLRAEHAVLQTSHSSLTQTMQQLQTELRDVRISNADLRQQNQMFVDILQEKTINGDLVTGSAVLNRSYADIPPSSEETSSAETSEMDDVPDVPGIGKTRKRALRHAPSSSDTGAQDNLANELNGEAAGSKPRERQGSHRHTRSGTTTTDLATLQKENQELRESNRALTLYINKILDRIIAREGYENVLAVDSEQRRTLRAKASRMHMSPGRPTILPSSSPEKSTGLTRAGLGRGVPSTLNEEIRTPKTSTSRDWRSYLPLVGTPQTPQSGQTGDTSGFGSARRISHSEEVEDQRDLQERERIRQSMLKEGLVPPEHQLKSQKRQSTSFGTFFARIMGTPTNDEAGSSAKSGAGTSATQGAQPNYLKIPSSISEGGATESVSGTSDAGSSSLSTQEMRQRALEAGDAPDNLTDMPERKERRLSRRLTSRTSLTSTGTPLVSPRLEKLSIGDTSRGPSEAGDESYGYMQARSPDATTPTASAMAASSGVAAANDTSQEPGWRKALKRVSLLYPVSATAIADQAPGAKSPTTAAPAESK